MKTEDLRIGNYVKCVDGNIIRINKDDMMCILMQTYEVKPIPLKEEILRNCRFRGMDTKKMYLPLTKIKSEIHAVWMHRFKAYVFELHSHLHPIVLDLTFLHELQNLCFALTGEELEVNL